MIIEIACVKCGENMLFDNEIRLHAICDKCLREQDRKDDEEDKRGDYR